MKQIARLKSLFAISLLLATFVFASGGLLNSSVSAVVDADHGGGDSAASSTDLGSTSFNSQECPAGQARYDSGEGSTCCPTSVAGTAENKVASACAFAKYINPIVTLLSALVGIVVVISIIVAGIQYSSAEGDPSKVAAAKDRIRNSIFALIAYVFLFSVIQWLIPGGIL